MKSVIITEAFAGYPDGETERAFRPSPEPISVPNDFADLIVNVKKHARWPKAKPKPAPQPKPSPEPKADPEPKPEADAAGVEKLGDDA